MVDKYLSRNKVMNDLQTVLNYKHEDVVLRFAEDFKISVSDSEDVFLELKRWLWICAKRHIQIKEGKAESFRLPLFNEAYIIDMMWHSFLLFTKDYQEFCEEQFGFFIHHNPRPHKERIEWKDLIEKDREKAESERKATLQKVYSYLYDELGEEILLKWCEEYPKKFRRLY